MRHLDAFRRRRQARSRRTGWRWIGAAVLAAGLWLSLAAPVGAQRFPTRVYTEKDGLRSSTVHSLAQDRSGRIWFATRNGVIVYDGFEWSQPAHNPVPPFAGYELLEIDGEGTWAASRDTTLPVLRLDDRGELVERVTAPFRGGDDDRRPTATTLLARGEDGRQSLVIGTWGSGLRVWSGAGWTAVTDAAGRRDYPVYTLEPVDGGVVVGTDTGVSSLAGDRLVDDWSDLLPADSREVYALAREDLGGSERLWVVGRDWVGRIEAGSFRMVARPVRIRFNPTRDLLHAVADGRGGLFFGSSVQLLHLSSDGVIATWGRGNGLASDGATDLLLDRERNVWIASPRGMSRISTLRFAIYDSSQGLLEDEVSSIIEPAPGEIALGHNTGVTILRDGAVAAIHPLDRPDLSDEQVGRVLDMAVDRAGNLWAAVGQFGLARIAPDGSVRWTGGGLAFDDRVDVVRVDERDRVIAGTGRGLARLDGDRLVPLDTPGLARIHSRKLESGPDGTLYLATPGEGLFVRVRERWIQALGTGETEGDSYLFTVLPAQSGRVWVGSAAGLRFLDDGVLRQPPEPPLHIDRPVYLLVEDRDGTLWIGTDYGIYRWDGSVLDHFTGRGGLPGNEANRDAGLVDHRGRLWIGTDRGVSLILDRSRQELHPPPVVDLLSVEVDGGRTASPLEPLELGYREDGLTFRVRAVSFLAEGGIEYRTRLTDGDGPWAIQEGPGRLESRFSALAPGSYVFQVQARSQRSGWSPVVTSAPIEIARPFWRQAWFVALCGLALVGAGVGGHRFRSQRRYARKLETQVVLRTEELAASRRSIEAERERLARTLESVADGLAATDGEGRVLLWNRAAEELTGASAQEAFGRRLCEVLPLTPETSAGGPLPASEPIDVAAAILEHDRRGRAPETFVFVDRFGRQRTVELTGAPTAAANESRGVVVAFRDVTERRRLEDELVRAQRLESLGVLAGGIAHDFNNLLTVILGYVSLVQAAPGIESGERDDLDHALRALGRAQDLSRRLLTFSHGGAPMTGAVTVAEVIRESADFTCRGSNVRCVIDVPDDLWAAEADESQVSQVLNNLLINAIQAMPGGGTVSIAADNVEIAKDEVPGLRAGRFVHVCVEDGGPGIPPEVLPRVFDPFFTTKDEGSGIGLTTVYSILRKHRGAVTVDSTPGQGTRFDLYLPATARLALVPEPPAPVAFPGRLGCARRILVMDDQPAVRGVLESLLRRLGYGVVGTADGDEAVERYRRALDDGARFDAVILDLTVPGGKGGADALSELMLLDPSVTAIASSGYADDAALSAGALGGFTARLPKPYRLADLAEVLERFLDAPGDLRARAGGA